jgi:hypothetical protein
VLVRATMLRGTRYEIFAQARDVNNVKCGNIPQNDIKRNEKQTKNKPKKTRAKETRKRNKKQETNQKQTQQTPDIPSQLLWFLTLTVRFVGIFCSGIDFTVFGVQSFLHLRYGLACWFVSGRLGCTN